MKSMKDIQERRSKDADAEAHFGSHVAATLRRLQPRQRAIAKLQIDQILLNAEFPCEPMGSHGNSAFSAYSPNMSYEPTYHPSMYQSQNP